MSQSILSKITFPLLLAALLGFVSAVQAQDKVPYIIEELTKPTPRTEPKDGRNVTFITVHFKVSPTKALDSDETDYELAIYEENKRMIIIPLERSIIRDAMSVVLSMDTSGSMAEGGRMEETQKAAMLFFRELPARADTGLILFNHNVYKTLPLSKNRPPVLDAINTAKPDGGTAYLDSCIEALKMLDKVQYKKKSIVIMTDGVDLNSKAHKELVIQFATRKNKEVKIYTVGIGKAGNLENVTSILVLDQSGSMLLPAGAGDKESRLDALKAAAKGFVETIRYTKEELVRSSVLQFSDKVANPINFTNNHDILNSVIDQLHASGETAVFDATYAGIEALVAENPPGKKAVIALTDGIDNSSRHRVEEVIARAREENIPLYMLGFGPKGKLAEDVMIRMAEETGGKYYHASNKEDLMRIFENLSLKLHDDGIDEITLRELAERTGGRYFHAKDIESLELKLKDVTSGLLQDTDYRERFASQFQGDDGRARNISYLLYPRGKSPAFLDQEGYDDTGAIAGVQTGYFRPGLLMAQADPLTYLGMLVLLGILLALPAGWSRLKRGASQRQG
jgi:Mg-chelatase subunit ChlD